MARTDDRGGAAEHNLRGPATAVMDIRPGDPCEVYELGRWRSAIVDSAPEFGWVCVVGIPGRAGSASVPIGRVRLPSRNC